MLEQKDIDAVIIGTPDHWHCLLMVNAVQAGKDVYVEKPMANTIEECNIMVKAARNYNRIVQVGQQQRSGFIFQKAMELIKSGNIGKLRKINIWANFDYGADRPLCPMNRFLPVWIMICGWDRPPKDLLIRTGFTVHGGTSGTMAEDLCRTGVFICWILHLWAKDITTGSRKSTCLCR